MTEDELFARLVQLVDKLSSDYERLSHEGKEAYTELMSVIAQLM